MLNFKHKISDSQKGFTLVEMVFVLAIFVIILSIALGIFVSIIQQQQRILKEQEALNQTSYAMEYMSRALRMATVDLNGTCLGVAGYTYLLTNCNNGTLSACSGIKFINQADNDSCDEFFWNNSGGAGNSFLELVKNGGAPQNLLSNTLNIKNVEFILNGNTAYRFTVDDGAFIQPRVTMLMDVQMDPSANLHDNIVQTTVSPRDLHIQ